MVGQIKGLYLGLLVTLVGLILSWAPYGLDLEEQYGLRWLFWSRGVKPAPHEVLIIALDSRSAKRNDWSEKPDHWPRTRHAQLTDILARACARVIVYDLFFRAPRPAPEDDVFAHAIRSAGNVVLVGHLGIAEDERLPQAHQADIQTVYFPVPALEEAAAAVTPFPLPNAPEGVTGFWAFKTTAGDSPTLPTVAFQLYALNVYEDLVHLLKKVDPQQASRLPEGEKGVRASTKGTTELALHLREMFRTAPQTGRQLLAALDEVSDHDLAPAKKQTIRGLINLYQGDDWRYLNFYGPPRSVTTINYPAAMELAASAGKCNERNIFSGKAIFIGISETSSVEQKDKDIFDTVFSDPSGLKLSGVEIAATAVGNLMEDKPVRRLDSLASLGIVIGWGFLVTIVWRSFVTWTAFLVSLAGTLSYLGATFYAFKTAGTWVPVAVPLLQLFCGTTLAIAGNRKELEEHINAIRHTLTEWLPPIAIDQLVASPEIVRRASGLVYGACMHTDVAGFTTVSERIDPIELSAMMNDYFLTIGQPVTRREGFVSDQTGDAMLAIWAAAEPDIHLRYQACEAALDISEALVRFHATARYPALSTRIGLHAGRIAVGGIRMGATEHYRSFGVIVNTAQRIQGLNKVLRTRILASRDVLQGLSSFLMRPVGAFVFAGLTFSIDVFEIVGRKAQSADAPRRGDRAWLCTAFADALEAYQEAQWQSGIEQLVEILDVFPEDGPARFYLRRCQFYLHHPPAGLWDPIIRQ